MGFGETLRVHPSPSPAPAGDETTRAACLTALVHRQELFLRGADWVHRMPPGGLRRTSAAWFGVGVTTSSGLSKGLPLDVLGLVYAQELVRRALGLRRSVVLVADSNAQAAGAEPLAVRRVAVGVERRLRDVVDLLGLPAEVRLASSLARTEGLPELRRLRDLPPYVAHQLAQTERLRQEGIDLKLGWAWPGAVQDERYFDDLYARELGARVTSVYVGGGTTLDPRRPRACPYVCSEPAARLLLDPREELERKLAHAPKVARQRYERILGKLARAHCHVTGAPRPRRAVVLVQDLLDALPWHA